MVLALLIPMLPLSAAAAPWQADAGILVAEQFEVIPLPDARPRLFLREGDVAGVRTRWEAADSAIAPELVILRNTMRTAQASVTNGILPPSVGPTFNRITNVETAMQTNALLYLMYRNDPNPAVAAEAAANGRLAIRLATQFLQTLNWGPGMDVYGRLFQTGAVLVTTAMVYDWCYPLMTAADKAIFLDRWSHYANFLEFGGQGNNPDQGHRGHGVARDSFPNNQSFAGASMINGHNVEEQHAFLTAMAIAAGDDFPYYWEIMSHALFTQYLPTQVAMLSAGAHWQGESYGPSRMMTPARVNAILYRMQEPGSRKSFMDETTGLKVAYSFLYYRRPDGKLHRMGDTFVYSVPHGGIESHGELLSLLYLNAIFHDPFVQNELVRVADYRPILHNRIVEAFLLWSDVEPATSYDELPLTFMMPSPRGEMIAMTEWYDLSASGITSTYTNLAGGTGSGPARGVDLNSNAMSVLMKIGERWMGNHDHWDAGHFEVFYRGTMATDAGIYGPAAGWGTPIDSGWTSSTIAHNSLLIYDPNLYSRFAPIDASTTFAARADYAYFDRYFNFSWRNEGNHGGQRPPDSGFLPQTTHIRPDGTLAQGWDTFNDGTDPGYPAARNWHSGTVLSQGIQAANPLRPDWSYMKGDLGPLYTYRAEEANRSFMFLNFKNDTYPGALLVFDRVTTTDESFTPIFLMHTVERPIANYIGEPTELWRHNETAANTDQPVIAYTPILTGTEQYIAGNQFTVQRTPQANEFIASGGQMVNTILLPRADNLQTKLVTGLNLPDGRTGWAMPNLTAAAYSGLEFANHMIQISPKTPARTDMMLNVMQTSEIGTTPLNVTMIGEEDQALVGARLTGSGINTAVLFSTSGQLIDGSVTVPAAGSGSDRAHYIIADLTGGTWIARNAAGAAIATFIVDASTNVGEFFAPVNGVYTLAPAVPLIATIGSTTFVVYNQPMTLGQAPVLFSGTRSIIMVPYEALAAIADEAAYNVSTGAITLRFGETSIAFNRRQNLMGVTPYLRGGSLMVPLNYVADQLGWEIELDGRTITLIKTDAPAAIPGTAAPRLTGATAFLENIVLTFDSPLSATAFDKNAFTVTGIRNNDQQAHTFPFNQATQWGGGAAAPRYISSWPEARTTLTPPPIAHAYISEDRMRVVLSMQHNSLWNDVNIRVSYNGSGGLSGANGPVAAFSDIAVTNTNDPFFTRAPFATSATVEGNRVMVFFNRAIYARRFHSGNDAAAASLGIPLVSLPDVNAFTIPGHTITATQVYGEVLILTLESPVLSTTGNLTVSYAATGVNDLNDGYDLFNAAPLSTSRVANFSITARNVMRPIQPVISKTMTHGFSRDPAMTALPANPTLAAGLDPMRPTHNNFTVLLNYGADTLAATGVDGVRINGVALAESNYTLSVARYTNNVQRPELGLNASGIYLSVNLDYMMTLPVGTHTIEVTFNNAARTVSSIQFTVVG
jgi:heparin/heparan-sulfate lyase